MQNGAKIFSFRPFAWIRPSENQESVLIWSTKDKAENNVYWDILSFPPVKILYWARKYKVKVAIIFMYIFRASFV